MCPPSCPTRRADQQQPKTKKGVQMWFCKTTGLSNNLRKRVSTPPDLRNSWLFAHNGLHRQSPKMGGYGFSEKGGDASTQLCVAMQIPTPIGDAMFFVALGSHRGVHLGYADSCRITSALGWALARQTWHHTQWPTCASLLLVAAAVYAGFVNNPPGNHETTTLSNKSDHHTHLNGNATAHTTIAFTHKCSYT